MHRPRIISLLATGLTLSATSLGAQGQSDDEATPAKPQTVPLLAGPPVEEGTIPGVESSFSMMNTSRMAQAADRSVPPREFQRALRTLVGQDASEGVRLTPAQLEAIRAHVRAFERQRRAYMREHADTLARVRSVIGDRPRGDRNEGDGDTPSPRRQRPDDAMTTMPSGADATDHAGTPADDERQALIARARQIRRGAPQPIEAQTKVWAELTDAQRAHLERQFEAWHKERAENVARRDQERYAREIAQRMEERAAEQANDHGELRRWFGSLPAQTQRRVRERLSRIPEERRQALIDRLASLPAERREAVLERLLTARSGVERAVSPRPPR